MNARSLARIGLATALAATASVAAAVPAQAAPAAMPTLTGTSVSNIGNEPGDQTDPHVSGDWVT